MSLEINNQTPSISDLFRKGVNPSESLESFNFLGLDLISEEQFPIDSDTIIVEPGADLPGGMTRHDIQDALDQAREVEKQACKFTVLVGNEVVYEGKHVAGVLQGTLIKVSIAEAKRYAAYPTTFRSGYVSAPAHQQLWVSVFEEALHCARKAAGKDQGSYFTLPADPTAEDIDRYLLQEQEAAVDKVLNGGILEAKFGSGVVYKGKMVLHKVPVLSFPIKADDKNYPAKYILGNLPYG